MLLALVGLSMLAAAPAPPPIDPAQAQTAFQEAKAISDRDGGRLWGVPLYGPIFLTAPETRFVIANQADTQGLLSPSGPVFTGRLPEAVNVSDTPTDWAGLRWTQLIWPLPADEAAPRPVRTRDVPPHPARARPDER